MSVEIKQHEIQPFQVTWITTYFKGETDHVTFYVLMKRQMLPRSCCFAGQKHPRLHSSWRTLKKDNLR